MGRSRGARCRIGAPRRLETALQPRNWPGIGRQDGWGRREARAAGPGPEGGRKWCSCHATGLERVIHRGGAVVALAVSGWGPSAAENGSRATQPAWNWPPRGGEGVASCTLPGRGP